VVYDLNLPEGCPTEAVNEFEGVANRVVKTDPPTHSDLLTYLEMNSTPTADPCKRGAISLFAALDQAQHRLDISPYLGKYVASIRLTTSHGRCTSPNKFGHMSWWPYLNMRNASDLKVIGQ
jgi:hypothetical protein